MQTLASASSREMTMRSAPALDSNEQRRARGMSSENGLRSAREISRYSLKQSSNISGGRSPQVTCLVSASSLPLIIRTLEAAES